MVSPLGRFGMFSQPVDVEDVPDYLDVISQPIDLETMMTKIDRHEYTCAQDFLADIDLIVANALEYNPNHSPEDQHIRWVLPQVPNQWVD